MDHNPGRVERCRRRHRVQPLQGCFDLVFPLPPVALGAIHIGPFQGHNGLMVNIMIIPAVVGGLANNYGGVGRLVL